MVCIPEAILELLGLIVYSLHLNGIETTHVHLHQSVPPVEAWNSGIMNTTRNIAEILSIFHEAVIIVVYRE